MANDRPQATPAAASPAAESELVSAARALHDVADALKPARTPAHLVKIRTPWNPEGKSASERPKLRRPTMQNGAPVREFQSSDEEIELWNKLRPGRFGPNRKYVVVVRPSDRAVDLRYVNKTIEDRMAIANDHKGRGLVGLLELCVNEAEDRKKNPAKYSSEDLDAV